MFDLYPRLKKLEAFRVDAGRRFVDIMMRFDRIQERLDRMPTRADLDQAKLALQQAITDATNRVVATISDLQSQLANGSPITQADLDDLRADVASLAQIDVAPAPTPAPGPTP